MPIRFRCPHCQQLLGIARRKAGTSVNCPTCHQSVLVPLHDVEEDAPSEAANSTARKTTPASGHAPAQPSLLFERDDFEEMLNAPKPEEAAARRPAVPPPPPAGYPPPPPTAPEDQFLAEAVPPGAGIVLSPARTTVLTVVVIVLVAAAFAAGVIVGRSL
jgi:hypothetical protein